jgi:hypothetical protein
LEECTLASLLDDEDEGEEGSEGPPPPTPPSALTEDSPSSILDSFVALFHDKAPLPWLASI